ncbi:hypothetical protein JMJ56_27240 [Belnapia sp. T18]|uniref:Uncharacterized protein n=1 Tax=Belnapia arida TaxID=2804533 RepID=A0ABS1UEJ1_9PROT|nr:hypothetical protein [Belnapia arida]MBL6081686.1 hypothetical protein [Belnapia arida]
MARIPREEHATIVHRVDVEGHKVADVAAAYGCTPANIYAILAKQRRQGAGDAAPGVQLPSPVKAEPEAKANSSAAPVQAVADDLFGGLLEAPPEPLPPPLPASLAPDVPLTKQEKPTPPAPPSLAQPDPQPRLAAPARAGRSAAAPKPATSPRAGKAGYALLMRASDGEEAVNPFRSLDELLSAAQPILRTAARSPEPVWFSIQQVDLDALGDDA